MLKVIKAHANWTRPQEVLEDQMRNGGRVLMKWAEKWWWRGWGEERRET
jgi:hypothetical protein